MKICILNPGIENHQGSPSSNLGDLIIQEAIKRELSHIFINDSDDFVSISTQKYLQKDQVQILKSSQFTLVGGSNLLSSNMNSYRQWKISPLDAFKINEVILFGVGWWQYQPTPNLYTKVLLKSVLSHSCLHSVRDNYTKNQLESAGFENILNTGCPTMWPLADIGLKDIKHSKAKNVLLMLTDYAKQPKIDARLIDLLLSKYDNVFFWPQGRGDLDYIRSFDRTLKVLEHSFDAFQDFLASDIDFDYIGTRLHGGIKCLLAHKRSLIIEVDNRAKEISHDTNLQTVERDNFAYISAWIDKPFLLQIKLNLDDIEHWKRQFYEEKIS